MEIKERNLNELNVFKYDYASLKYLKSWFTNIKQFFRNIKWAWQRATKGYCDRDAWNLDSYYLQLFYHTLKHLAKNTHGYPGTGEFADTEGHDGYEAWQKYLSDMADHFENAQEWNEELPINQEINDLHENMEQYVSSCKFEPCIDTPNYSQLVYKYTDEKAYNQAKDKWLAKENEAGVYRNKEKDVAFDMMKTYFFHLWD